MINLFIYLKITFDLSLARGLDYYTGIIYEAVTEHSGPPSKNYLTFKNIINNNSSLIANH
jgi:histidyl-tRNA synthetase